MNHVEPPQSAGKGTPPPQIHVDTRLPRTSAKVLEGLFRRILRRSLLVVALIALVGCVAGYLVSGAPGLWGALTGVALAGSYLLITVVVMIVTADRSQTFVSAAIGVSWLVKTVVTLGVIIALANMDFYSPGWLLATVALAILSTLAVEMSEVSRARVGLDPAPGAPTAASDDVVPGARG